jgi:predicted ribosomally synthesized peptide with SipW-like signal peptide
MVVQPDDRQNSRKKVGLIVGLVALVVAAAAIGAGTYAAFTDTETGPGGTQTAGTLDLEVGSGGTTSTLFTASNIAPGFSQDYTFTLKNAGTIAGTLSTAMTLTGGDGTCTEPERTAEGTTACNPNGNLQDQMQVTVVSSPVSSTPTAPASLASFAGAPLPGSGSLKIDGGQTVTYTLRFTLPNDNSTTAESNPNNKVQGDTVSLNSTFNLVQS